MAEMHVCHAMTGALELSDGLPDRTEGAPPADEQQVTFGRPEHLGRRNLTNDARDLARSDAHHLFVVRGRVTDVAGQILLLETADAVLEARRPGDDPGTRQRLLVA